MINAILLCARARTRCSASDYIYVDLESSDALSLSLFFFVYSNSRDFTRPTGPRKRAGQASSFRDKVERKRKDGVEPCPATLSRFARLLLLLLLLSDYRVSRFPRGRKSRTHICVPAYLLRWRMRAGRGGAGRAKPLTRKAAGNCREMKKKRRSARALTSCRCFIERRKNGGERTRPYPGKRKSVPLSLLLLLLPRWSACVYNCESAETRLASASE